MRSIRYGLAILATVALLPAYAAQAAQEVIPFADDKDADGVCLMMGGTWELVLENVEGVGVISYWQCYSEENEDGIIDGVIFCDDAMENCTYTEFGETSRVPATPVTPARPGVFEVAPVSPGGPAPGVFVAPGTTVFSQSR